MEKEEITFDERKILKEWRLLKKQRKGELQVSLKKGWVYLRSSVPRLSECLINNREKVLVRYWWKLSSNFDN